MGSYQKGPGIIIAIILLFLGIAYLLRRRLFPVTENFYKTGRVKAPVVDTSPPVFGPPGSGIINVKDASYGTNCGVPSGYLTRQFQKLTEGKNSFSYANAFNNIGGDPRVGCPKNFSLTYDCSDGVNRNFVPSNSPSAGEHYSINITCPPPAPAPVGAIVVLSQHCGGGGWTKNLLSPGTYISGTHFDWDVSQIRVPAGVTAVVTGKTTPVYNVAGTGKVETVVGPGELNLCSAAPGGGYNGFNDNIATITLSATAAAPAPQVCPACPPCPTCPTCPRCPDMSLYMLRSECATEQGLLEGFASEQDIIEDFGNINVKEASYGTNCGVPPGYLTNVLRGATAGKLNYSYSGRFNNLGGDPRVGCAKNFNMTYDCSDGINRNISFGASDGEQYAMNINCPPDPPPAPAAPPPPPPPPPAPCPSCPPCTVCPPCPTCPDMSKYILRSDCRPPCPPPAPPQLPLTNNMATPTAPNTLNLPHFCKSLADNSGFMDMFARA
jgi:hypothetical protein